MDIFGQLRSERMGRRTNVSMRLSAARMQRLWTPRVLRLIKYLTFVLLTDSWRLGADLHALKPLYRSKSVVNMDRSMAQALTSLIPTLTGPLPPELLEIAVSLLAQSRSKASSLKADEEIARAYACANLACERCEASQ